MSVRSLQESYLFHDKKIYALVVSALHITCVLSVFFRSFLAETRKVPGVCRTGGTWGPAELAEDTQHPAWSRAVQSTALRLLVSDDLLAPRELP